jgi:hypothetical protein
MGQEMKDWLEQMREQNKQPLHIGELTIEPNDREGWTIKSTETHHVDLMRMLFNFRVVLTPRSCTLGWDHGWCYDGGSGPIVAIAAAYAWDPDKQAEPVAFTKRACECVRVIA